MHIDIYSMLFEKIWVQTSAIYPLGFKEKLYLFTVCILKFTVCCLNKFGSKPVLYICWGSMISYLLFLLGKLGFNWENRRFQLGKLLFQLGKILL